MIRNAKKEDAKRVKFTVETINGKIYEKCNVPENPFNYGYISIWVKDNIVMIPNRQVLEIMVDFD